MAKLRPPYLSVIGLEEADAKPRLSGRAWWPAMALVAGGLLALAWFDGGEEPIRPIAEDVPLPEQGQ